MRRLGLFVALLLVPLMWLGAEPAAACSCAPRPVAELIETADAVVLARLEQRKVDEDGQEAVYSFFGSERFKGDMSPGFEVHTPASGASCGLEGLVVGRRYVVYMDEKNGMFTANLCGGTRAASSTYVAKVEAVTGRGYSFDLPPPPPPPAPPESAVVALREVLSGLTLWS